MNVDVTKDPRFMAAVRLLERCGAKEFQLRWSDEEQPMVWIAVIVVAAKPEMGLAEGHQVAADFDPLNATLALCERAVDGGTCAHCHRATAFSADHVAHPVEEASAGVLCWYRFDPELATFRRSCEGMTTPARPGLILP